MNRHSKISDEKSTSIFHRSRRKTTPQDSYGREMTSRTSSNLQILQNVQAKLSIGNSKDKYEKEADDVADRFVGNRTTLQRACAQCGEENIHKLQRKSNDRPTSIGDPKTASQINAAIQGGKPLSTNVRQQYETHLGADFSNVRIHTGSSAIEASDSINARAFTLDNHIVFGRGQFRPEEKSGRHLLAHELTHVVQQNGGLNNSLTMRKATHLDHATVISNLSDQHIQCEARYTGSERSEMAAGRVTAETNDFGIAIEQGFRPGDIVFRLGSTGLAAAIREPVTHGGIYLGNGLIHDMVGFGNRSVRLSDFFFESADPSVVRLIRFDGPQRRLIIEHLIRNIWAQDFRLPSDPKPWNLFSDATNYETATCLEYSHAQFLHAINQLSADPSVTPTTRSAIRGEYFASGASTANDLISPHDVSVSGDIGVAFNIRRGLIAAADYLAEDVNSSVFQNRWEGSSTISNVGSNWFPVMIQTESLPVFTYQSFVDSRRYFDDIATPSMSTSLTPHSQRVVDVHALSGDSDIRVWVGAQSSSTLADLPGAQKAILIRRLLGGWVADEDVDVVVQLCLSVRTLIEMTAIKARITPLISSLNNLGQRSRITIALNRRP